MSVPYIGSKISLTSRSKVRYEGILSSVNPADSTITLENVMMMGTEGRVPGRELAPSKEVYDVVVFRSSDIDDLQIFEAPQQTPPSPPQPFVDPAIVTSNSKKMESNVPRLQFGSASKPTQGSSAPLPAVPTLATKKQFATINSDSLSGSLPKEAMLPSPAKVPTFGSLVKPAAAPSELPKQSFASAATSASFSSQVNNSNTSSTQNKVNAYNTATGKMEMVEKQVKSYASVVSAGAGRFRPNEASARMVPRTEYDFTQANSRLSREDLPEDKKQQIYYDKTSSFFDNISCDATGNNEKPERNERRLNIETFGVAAPPNSHHHHRHHHGHRGGRGGYRQGHSHSSQRDSQRGH